MKVMLLYKIQISIKEHILIVVLRLVFHTKSLLTVFTGFNMFIIVKEIQQSLFLLLVK